MCRRTKVTRAPCKRNPDDRADRVKIAERVGDLITADHKPVNEEQESRLHHRYAVVEQALLTQWIQSHPRKTRSAQETQRNLRNKLRPEDNPRSFVYEHFSGTCENWRGAEVETHRNPERTVRRVKEGTSSLFVQSGL